MNSVNLLTMMFAAPEAAGNPSSASQQAAPDLGFLLLLQTQLWQNSSPRGLLDTSGGESTGLFNALFAQATDAAAAAGLTGTEAGAGVVNAATEAGQLTPADLFSALLASLRQILQAGAAPLADPATDTTVATATNAATAAVAVTDAAAAGRDIPAGTVRPVATGAGPVNDGSLPVLIQVTVEPELLFRQHMPVAYMELTGAGQQVVDGWPAIVDRLNALLGALPAGPYTAGTSGLAVNTAQNPAPAVPWSLTVAVEPVVNEDGTAAGGQPVRLTPVASGGYWVPSATETAPNPGLSISGGLAGETPASIRWFQTAGIIPRPVEPMVAVVADAGTAALTTEMQLADGTTLRISLQSQAELPAQSGQVYNLRIELPGSEATALTATLTVQRLEQAPLIQPAFDAGVAAAAPLIADVAPATNLTALTAAPAGETLVANPVTVETGPVVVRPEAVANPLLISDPVASQVAAVDSRSVPVTAPAAAAVIQSVILEPIVTLAEQKPVQQALAAAETAAPVVAGKDVTVKPVKAHSGAPQAVIKVVQPVHSAPVDEVPTDIAVKAVAVPVAVAVPSSQQVAFDAWSAGQALSELNPQAAQVGIDVLGDSPAVTLSRATPAANSVIQPADVLNQPQAVVNLSDMPAQLLQFVDQPLEFRPYAGLQYLELADRIQQQVNVLRAGSGGFYQARLNLNPPNLGEMFVNISVRGDAVALQLCVVSTVPKEQLKDSLEALRQSLEDAGLYVTEIRVEQIDADGGGSGGRQQPGDGQSSSGDDSETGTKATSPVAGITGRATGAGRQVPALGFQ